ncbi:hypothetical protein [Gymnodinialimonas ceratoperidinii]|uniref:Uncharacterized protein n=1 Tax=Gymnodinialimonas ceratoperidinii TaxID=2856823 RepID=A0A8F6TV94_9RHOB|nr:hypothetical protein [Gymnodinialimonas ceratoperidinii]QXT39330.1 hypothetical protein KYE46_15600 [Gymnodinialimonas ceratoperidinii]
MEDRPGRWITNSRAAEAVQTAPAGNMPVMEAPASGPLIPVAPAPRFIISAPSASGGPLLTPSGSISIAGQRTVPGIRPVPRPTEIAAVDPAPEEAAPAQITETAPTPLPQAAETLAVAEAIAADLAAQARTIAIAAPREVPGAEGIAPDEAIARTDPAASEIPAYSPVAPAVVPALSVASWAETPPSPVRAGAAVLRIDAGPRARALPQPVAFVMSPPDQAPILPRLTPSGPVASARVAALAAPEAPAGSTHLQPYAPDRPTRLPRLRRLASPAFDPFPRSALPPPVLGEAPDTLLRAIQPPRPFAGNNSAVVFGEASVIPARLPVLPAPVTPAREAPVSDPDAAVTLPEPDRAALARMVNDATICWRLADMSVEAQWARLSVDVALDETNMPASQSIRLTGFAHAVSNAAEDAYRAAQSALVACAEATDNLPATAAATLVFDRNGVRLR